MEDIAKKTDVKLSIVMPVYNVEQYIRYSVESIFRQGLDENAFELIIVDDGTQDRSIDMISDIIDKQNNIIVISQENLGVSVARNNGIAMASGKYVYMMDSDDILIDCTISLLLEKALFSEADMAFADFLEMDNNLMNNIRQVSFSQQCGRVVKKTGEELFLQDQDPYQCYLWRILFRKDFLLGNHLSFQPTCICQDFLFLHECYFKAKLCIRVPLVILLYRRNRPFSSTASFSVRRGKDVGVVIARTWDLTKNDCSPEMLFKLKNNIFTLFQSTIQGLNHLETKSERHQVIDYMKELAPNLRFVNGKRQKLYTWFYCNFPYCLISLSRYL